MRCINYIYSQRKMVAVPRWTRDSPSKSKNPAVRRLCDQFEAPTQVEIDESFTTYMHCSNPPRLEPGLGVYREGKDAKRLLISVPGLGQDVLDNAASIDDALASQHSTANFGFLALLSPQEMGDFKGTESAMDDLVAYQYDRLKKTVSKGTEIFLTSWCMGVNIALKLAKLIEDDGYFTLKHTYLQNPSKTYAKAAISTGMKSSSRYFKPIKLFKPVVSWVVARQLRNRSMLYDVAKLPAVSNITVVSASKDSVNSVSDQSAVASHLVADQLVFHGGHSGGLSLVMYQIGMSLPEFGEKGCVYTPFHESLTMKKLPGDFILAYKGKQPVSLSDFYRLPLETRKAYAKKAFLIPQTVTDPDIRHSILGFYIDPEGSIRYIRTDYFVDSIQKYNVGFRLKVADLEMAIDHWCKTNNHKEKFEPSNLEDVAGTAAGDELMVKVVYDELFGCV